MGVTYYRLHRTDAPEFTTANAYSGLWGSTWNADGSQTECHNCSESDGSRAECKTCDGTGWEDAANGYSCCRSAEDLLDYFDRHCPADDTDPVVVFDGDQIGTGFDSEPLVIPTTTIRWTTIGALRHETAT